MSRLMIVLALVAVVAVATLTVRGASSQGNVLMIVGLQMFVGAAANPFADPFEIRVPRGADEARQQPMAGPVRYEADLDEALRKLRRGGRVAEIAGRESGYPFMIDIFGLYLGVEGQCGQYRQFVGGVYALDIVPGIRFGVAQLLGLLQSRVEIELL